MYEQIRKNKIRTAIIIIIFAAVVIAVASFAGYYFVGDFLTGAVLGVGIGTVYILISMSNASGSMLRMTNARRIDKNSTRNVDEQQVYNIVSQLAMMEQLPEPDVYIVKDQQPNAFAVGMSPKSASVAVTTGLMNRLNRAEMEGVIAHEIAHIKNYDSRLKVTAFALGSILVMIGHVLYRSGMFSSRGRRRNSDSEGNAAMIGFLVGLIIVVFGNIFSKFMQMWVSRKREYLADASAAEMTRNPEALASALEKISGMEPSQQADSAMSAMYFFNPFKNSGDSIWSTHPSTENRIKALRNL